MKRFFTVSIRTNLLISILLITNHLYGQSTLHRQFTQIADTIIGNIGISALHLETGESISFNGNKRFPMQSVYKFPIAMVMLKEIDEGKFSLEDTILINKSEYIPAAGHSPIRDKYQNGAKLTIKEILEYNISHSDGTACDVLLRLLGGTDKVEKSIHDLGVKDIAITNTEMIQVANDTVQYQNWSTTKAMNKLLEIFYNSNYLSGESQKLLLAFMSISNKWFDRRIKGLLPEDTELAHKTGTSRTYNGLTRATNDVGIITLPDGSHLVISIFISDSYDSQKKREMTIAQAAKAAYDYWTKQNKIEN